MSFPEKVVMRTPRQQQIGVKTFLCRPGEDVCLVNSFVGWDRSVYNGAIRLLSFTN